MEGDLISLLQSRMDKCTIEQFWAVGVITGLSALLIKISLDAINRKRLLPKYFVIFVIAAQLILTAYGIYFVVHRHISFYKFEGELSCLLKDTEIAPEILKEKHNPWKGHALSGVVFYTIWILLACAGVVSCYIRPLKTCNGQSP